ncbi:spheroidene monooxygenase [Tateyamaria pelophila]|uniref:spheroidene monooxygenase n=1 Tax=Tateyamaria pelophila TaxID=328415 RepID=UPI001CBE0B4A|nr:spheroidene monooxygenase [Tateyamaria pelophila]
MNQTTTLSFFRFDRWQDRAWALTMMGAARLAMPRVPDIGFWKLCGSGTGEGFTPRPNTAVYAILCTWPDVETARDRVANTTIFQKYRARATEDWTIFLTPTSARGNWSGQEPFLPVSEPESGPLAALTRATIKPGILPRFWSRVPDISAVIGKDPNVVFKIGIGEVPMLHQITFSIWPGATEMAAFARQQGGPHAEAIKAVREGAWFKEELYARFAILGDTGTWGGKSPLQGLDLS